VTVPFRFSFYEHCFLITCSLWNTSVYVFVTWLLFVEMLELLDKYYIHKMSDSLLWVDSFMEDLSVAV